MRTVSRVIWRRVSLNSESPLISTSVGAKLLLYLLEIVPVTAMAIKVKAGQMQSKGCIHSSIILYLGERRLRSAWVKKPTLWICTWLSSAGCAQLYKMQEWGLMASWMNEPKMLSESCEWRHGGKERKKNRVHAQRSCSRLQHFGCLVMNWLESSLEVERQSSTFSAVSNGVSLWQGCSGKFSCGKVKCFAYGRGQ